MLLFSAKNQKAKCELKTKNRRQGPGQLHPQIKIDKSNSDFFMASADVFWILVLRRGGNVLFVIMGGNYGYFTDF